MQTRIELDSALIEEARRAAGLRSTRETIDAALREFIERRRQNGMVDLVGRNLIAGDHDIRSVRAGLAG